MRDRTLVILALLFLLVTIGFGVNRALAVCNRMMGKPVAPELSKTFHRQWPLILDRAEAVIEEGKTGAKFMLARNYRFLVQRVKQVIAGIGSGIKTRIRSRQERSLKI